MSNYATKFDIKCPTVINTSEFAKMADLASLKSDVDKLDIDQLKTTPVDLSKLSYIVKNDAVKRTGYNELIKKVNATQTIDTSNLVKKTNYGTKIVETENKIPDHDKYITTTEFIS